MSNMGCVGRTSRVWMVVASVVAFVDWGREGVAGPLDLGCVAADSKWIMHLDMDAARESTVMQRAYAMAVKMHPHSEHVMAMVSGMTGMDPRKDLHGITAYGMDADKRNAVMIVHADARRDFLTKMVEKATDHKKSQYGDYVLHSWTHKGWQRGWSGPAVGAFFNDDVIVFGRTETIVKAAIDLLAGSAKGIPGTGAMLSGRTRPGSILIARAVAVDPNTRCPVLKPCSAFRVAFGEDKGALFYRGQLEMQNNEAAADVESVVRGFVALASLKYGNEEAAKRIMKEITVDTDKSVCTIRWDASTDDAWSVMEQAAKTWEHKRQQRAIKGMLGQCQHCDQDGCKGCPEPGKCPLEAGQSGGGAAERPLTEDEF